MQDDETFDEFFSERLRDLYSRIKAARSKQERCLLMQEFSSVFADEYDASDSSANEGFHKFLEDYETTKLAHTQATMQLARMGMDFMDTMKDVGDESQEESKSHATVVERRLN